MFSGPIDTIRTFLAAVAGGGAVLLAMLFFYEGLPLGPLRDIPVLGHALELVTDGRVDRERKAAVAGYVKQAELDAANAKLAAEQQRRQAAERTLSFYSRQYAAEIAEAEAEKDRLEQGIADNERKLAQAGRACLLDGADIEWLRNVERHPSSGGK